MSDDTTKASIGSIVHFVFGDQHLPAIVTDPEFPVVGGLFQQTIEQAMTVFPVGEPSFTTCAAYDADGAPATWHWPEAVVDVSEAVETFYEATIETTQEDDGAIVLRGIDRLPPGAQVIFSVTLPE